MIEQIVERMIVVRDSDPDDESSFTIYALDVMADDDRRVMMPESVWLNLDDTEQLGRELIALAQVLREERAVPVDAEPPVAKKAAPRKRAAKKVAP